MKYVNLGLLCVLFFCCASAQADDRSIRYSLEHYTDESGLPQNSVTHIQSDREGFIWLATQNGLVRFDGHRFLIWKKGDLGTATHRISGLMYDRAGNLLALTNFRELIFIRNGRPSLFPAPNITAPLMASRSMILAHAPTGFPTDHTLKGTYFTVFVRLGSDSSVIVDGDTVRFFFKEAETSRTYVPGASMLLGVHNIIVRNGQLYYIGKDNKIWKAGQTVAPVAIAGASPGAEANPEPLKLIRSDNPDGTMFLIKGRNAYTIDSADAQHLHVSLIAEGFDFNGNNIRAIHHDRRHGRVFLGSSTNGLYVLKSKKEFRVLKAEEGPEPYYAQVPLGRDRILTGIGNVFGMSGYIGKLGSIRAHADRWSILVDRHGGVWTKDNYVLTHFSPNGSILQQWTFPDFLTMISESPDGNTIWLGAYEPGKLYALKPGSGQKPVAVLEGLPGVQCFRHVTRQSLWIGTYNGLYHYDLPSGKAQLVKGTRGKYIRSIYISDAAPEEVWLTIEGEGLYHLRSNVLTALPLDKKQYLKNAHCIVEDGTEHFWMPTNHGLFVVSKKSLYPDSLARQPQPYYFFYGKEHGFNTNEFNGGGQPVGLRLPNGWLSFSSMDGLVVFDPAAVQPEFPASALHVDAVLNGNERILPGNTITWNDRKNVLLVEFSTPYFGSANNLYPEYQLDANRPVPLKEGNVQLNSLSPGTHKLVLMMRNGPGSGDIIRRELALIVPAYWWETWWSWLGSALIGMLIVMGLIRLRTRALARENRRLEAVVRSRTGELRAMIKTLETSENKLSHELHFQQNLNQNITHNIKTPLKYLEMSMDELVVLLERMEEKRSVLLGRRIHSSMQQLYYNADNLVTYMKARRPNGLPVQALCNMHALVERITLFFSNLYFLTHKNVRIENNVDREADLITYPQLVEVIIYNLVDNASKNTKSGLIEISSAVQEEGVTISVSDTGIGMDARQLEQYRKYFNDTTNAYLHIGLGFSIIKELLPFVKGRLSLESGPGKGTTISLTLKEHTLSPREQETIF